MSIAKQAPFAMLLLVAVFSTLPAQATTPLLSNLANSRDGDYGGDPDSANPFTTGSEVMNLATIDVDWYTLGAVPGVNRVAIYTDHGGQPSTTQVGTFFTNPNPTSTGVMTYTGYATLAPGTTYWMVVDITDDSLVAYNDTTHDFVADAITGGAAIPAGSAFGNNVSGTWEADSASLLFALNGCVSGPTSAWLLSCRYRVEVQWTDFAEVRRDAFVASAATSDTALFYWQNPNIWEVLIKAIDACSLNNKHWIYFAAATNVGYDITVTDTQSPAPPKHYTNPLGHLAQATNDINAFNCP